MKVKFYNLKYLIFGLLAGMIALEIFAQSEVLPNFLIAKQFPMEMEMQQRQYQPNTPYRNTSLYMRLDSLTQLFEEVYPTAEVGISVYDLTDGMDVYAYQHRKLYRPASTQKVLTSVAALDQLGTGFPFQTEINYTGAISGGTLRGDLYVVGGLDPEFTNENLNMLADGVARAGIRRIEGRVIGDLSLKDSIYWGMGWSWDDTPEDFQPYICPLMLNKGYVEVSAIPGRKGEAATINVYPPSSFYQVDNRTRSRQPNGGKYKVTRNWLEDGNRILVTGNVTSSVMKTVNIANTPDYFLFTFIERLRERGIEIEPQQAKANYAFGEYKGSGNRLATTVHTLDSVMYHALKESDNLCAEAMFYRLGSRFANRKRIGSEQGAKAIEEQYSRVGLDPSVYNVADGSGVSLYNYTTAQAEVAFLKYAYNKPYFSILYYSLPIAGVDGTLKNRMKGTPAYDNVHAKTGTVKGVSSLAGYITTSGGHRLAFSIICNGVLRSANGRDMQDRFCIEMAK